MRSQKKRERDRECKEREIRIRLFIHLFLIGYRHGKKNRSTRKMSTKVKHICSFFSLFLFLLLFFSLHDMHSSKRGRIGTISASKFCCLQLSRYISSFLLFFFIFFFSSISSVVDFSHSINLAVPSDPFEALQTNYPEVSLWKLPVHLLQ